MKTSEPKKSENHLILTIEREMFLLPPGKNITEVLDCLSGLRRVKDEYFYNVEPPRHVIAEEGEVEFSVSCARRELITAEELRSVRESDREARKAKTEPATA